jgi:outer membrane protein TolC
VPKRALTLLSTVMMLGWHVAWPRVAPGVGIGEALRVALNCAPALISAEAQMSRADGQRLAAMASFLPTLQATDQPQYYHPYNNIGSRLVDGVVVPAQRESTDVNVASADFSLNLFNGGKDLENYRAATENIGSADLGLTAAMDTLLQQIVSDFSAASSAELKVASQKRVLGLDGELLRLAEQRYGGGFESRMELIKTRQQQLADQILLHQEQQALRSQLDTLSSDIGLPQSGGSWTLDPWLPVAPDLGMGRLSVHDDPEVESALKAVLAAQRQVSAARDGNYPTIALTAQYDLFGARSGSLSGTFPATRRTDYSVGLLFTIPLSSYVSVRGDVEQKTAELKSALSRYQTALTDAANRIVDAPARLAEARETLELAMSSARLARRNVGLAHDSYAAKQSDRLSVIAAQSLAEQSQLSLATARLDYAVAGWEMLRAAHPRRFPTALLGAVLGGSAGKLQSSQFPGEERH